MTECSLRFDHDYLFITLKRVATYGYTVVVYMVQDNTNVQKLNFLDNLSLEIYTVIILNHLEHEHFPRISIVLASND